MKQQYRTAPNLRLISIEQETPDETKAYRVLNAATRKQASQLEEQPMRHEVWCAIGYKQIDAGRCVDSHLA
jgi:hypothetical protein